MFLDSVLKISMLKDKPIHQEMMQREEKGKMNKGELQTARPYFLLGYSLARFLNPIRPSRPAPRSRTADGSGTEVGLLSYIVMDVDAEIS